MRQRKPNRGYYYGVKSARYCTSNHHKISLLINKNYQGDRVRHRLHFMLTLLSFGLWGIVWWQLILKSQGRQGQFFHGFDDAYWSHLIEREQPPAALHQLHFDQQGPRGQFDA